ncbi:GNAT family N-acetyltransferase [Amycolatopsis keratiniphila]|uniref:GNAT family N-acetyltransferase n=1 Tax=Amycolatopsis keratiniphila TaxID=129921 RepID=UPI0003A73474|nr:GNAT family N-acetyltransferase [Amycolatopsis keratiniphila]
MPAFRIHPATADRFGDVATILNPNGNDRACWCLAYRAKPADYSRLRGDERADHVRALCAADPAPGVLAYDGATPVGWCGVGPRAHLHRMTRSRTMPPIDDVPAWTVVCFVVRAGHRRKGVAHALLDGAVSYALARRPGHRGLSRRPRRRADQLLRGPRGDHRVVRGRGLRTRRGDPGAVGPETALAHAAGPALLSSDPSAAEGALHRIRRGEGRLQPTTAPPPPPTALR